MEEFDIQRTLAEIGIEDAYDYYIFCDGSGTNWREPIGFASLIYDRATGTEILSKGSMSFGTNNYAEILPVLFSLSKIKDLDKVCNHVHQADIAIITDSLVTANTINGIYGFDNNNPELWLAIKYFAEPRYKLRAFHIPRNSNTIAIEIDRVAGEQRKLHLTGDSK